MARKEPLVGVTMRVTKASGYDEYRDSLAQDWPVFLDAIAGPNNWFAIPNLGERRTIEYCTAFGVSALILSGGDDPGVFPVRDETELALLDWAAAEERPVLGICRGMQLMAIRAGARLKPINGHVATRHRVEGSIAGDVNSFHNLGLDGCPPEFKILATSQDGEIEAMAHQTLPWEGWMWHPEREPTPGVSDVRRAKKILELP